MGPIAGARPGPAAGLYAFLISPQRNPHRFLTPGRLFAWSLDQHEGDPMLDIILLASGLAFFALSIGYAAACERL
jgi:hypothetical protein